jgi:hypothetical protein
LTAKEAGMGLAKFIATIPDELVRMDLEVTELLSRLAGALGWSVAPDGEVTVQYDPARVSDRTIIDAFRGLGFEPVPVPVRATDRRNR